MEQIICGHKDDLYINRPCESDWSKCDHCDMQGICMWEFKNGERK